MSEPQTTAKIRLHSSKGTIDVELWAREIPKTSRWVIQAAAANGFKDTEFWGASEETVQFAEQLRPAQSKPEIHSRLRFNRRGLVGVRHGADGGLFMTLGPAPALTGKATVLGRIVGDGNYVVAAIGAADLTNGRFTYPTKISKSEALVEFFEDIVPETSKAESDLLESPMPVTKTTTTKKPKVVVSFDDEEDDSDVGLDIRMQSAHELLSDRGMISSKLQSPSPGSEVPSLADSVETANGSSQSDVEPMRAKRTRSASSDSAPEKRRSKTKEERDLETLEMLKAFQSRAKSRWLDDVDTSEKE
ncbi:unnamed protein product [Kuraishia capsulata CBS 1993]|uniref:PPIase cyclophilin-type domain-containing protein n=1 Tax=Kuraishia capsulata CBS 1993 TaxID=1382522 RepID=W6MSI4_9ASCO|nr:uncharacterized protein KUCA_T00005759001 [Kuraishia capsulata CBS 1993]CDK29766.1 unnamed protein product [Kuraishia capsulata CBS 1993]